VNFIEGSKKLLRFSSDSAHFMSTSSMTRNQESGLWGADCMISFSSFPMKMLAYEGAIFVPIAVPLICKKCSPLNVRLLCFSTNVGSCPVQDIPLVVL